MDFDLISNWAHTNRLGKLYSPTKEDMIQLVFLISKVLEGTEHGVTTYDAWKGSCHSLRDVLTGWCT